MPIFILLSTLTQQGVTTLKSNPERLREVNKDVEELGCRVLHQWATLGEFDFVNVVEAPDIATVARVSVSLGARGSTKIETLPALEIVHLPNDHTAGAKAGKPTPRAYMADNDLALGRMIEALSKSRFWPTTVVFVRS